MGLKVGLVVASWIHVYEYEHDLGVNTLNLKTSVPLDVFSVCYPHEGLLFKVTLRISRRLRSTLSGRLFVKLRLRLASNLTESKAVSGDLLKYGRAPDVLF